MWLEDVGCKLTRINTNLYAGIIQNSDRVSLKVLYILHELANGIYLRLFVSICGLKLSGLYQLTLANSSRICWMTVL